MIKKDEKNIEYKYELLSKDPKDIEKKVNEFVENEVKFQITIKNNFNLEWPGNGRTKLICDKSSDIKSNDIILNNLKFGQNQPIAIILNIKDIKVGLKKCIFHFSVDGKIYGNPLVLIVNVHENEEVEKLRAEYMLSGDEFDSLSLYKALQKNNFDLYKAFGSLFQ